MEEKEASAASNSTSPRSRKAFMLGVVNASEIKCIGDRKRRWDQQPGQSEGEEPPVKMPCEDVGRCEEGPVENNVRHDDDILEGIPLPPCQQTDDRLASSSPTLVVKEQIVVQTPSDVLNNLDINSSTLGTSSLNELNFSEGDQRVTIEIETVAVNPSCEDQSETSIEVVNPNATPDDVVENPIERSWETVNCKTDENKSHTSSPTHPESSDTIDRAASIDVESAGNVDPDVMEVILGISPSKTAKSPDQSEFHEVKLASNPNVGAVDNALNNQTEKGRLTECNNPLVTENEPEFVENKSEPHLTKLGSRLKGLVDYEDFSDESSQQSDKTVTVEPAPKTAEEVSAPCENSVDSKDEEFHDCVEQPIADESNYDSTSLNYTPLAQETDDLINNNPSDNDGTSASKSSLSPVNVTPNADPDKRPENVKLSSPQVSPEICTIVEKASPDEILSQEFIPSENLSEKQLINPNSNSNNSNASDTALVIAIEPSNSNKDETEIVPDSESQVTLMKDSTVVSLETVEETEASTEPTSQILSSESQSDSAPSNSQVKMDVDITSSSLVGPESACQSTESPETSEDCHTVPVPSPEKAIDNSNVINVEGKEPCRSPSSSSAPNSEERIVENLVSDIDTEKSHSNVGPSKEPIVNAISADHSTEKSENVESSEDPSISLKTTTAQLSLDKIMEVECETAESLQVHAIVNEGPELDFKDDHEGLPVKPSAKDEPASQEDIGKNSSIEDNRREPGEIQSQPLKDLEDNPTSSLSVILPEEVSEKNGSAFDEPVDGQITCPSVEDSQVEMAEEVTASTDDIAASGDKAEECLVKVALHAEANAAMDTLGEEPTSPKSVEPPLKQEVIVQSNLSVIQEKETKLDPSEINVESDSKIETVDSNLCKEDLLLKDEELDGTKSQGECIETAAEEEPNSTLLHQDENPPESLDDKDNEVETNEDVGADKPVCVNAVPLEQNVNNSMEVEEAEDNEMAVETSPLPEIHVGEKDSSDPSLNDMVSSKPAPVKDSDNAEVNMIKESLSRPFNNSKSSDVGIVSKPCAKDVVSNPVVIVSENNSVLSSVDLNMECESVDTVQSVESEASLPAIKEDVDMINSNSVIDISSDSACSTQKDKDKTSLTFDLSKINNSNKDITVCKFDNRSSTVISSDDDQTSMESEPKIVSKVDKSAPSKNAKSDVILVPDSDSSNSNIGSTGANIEKSRKVDNLSFSKIKMDKETFPQASDKASVETIPKTSKSPLRNEVCKLETNVNDVKAAKSKSSSDSQLTVNKKSDSTGLSNSISSSVESSGVIDKAGIDSGEEMTEEQSANSKNEPITLRIFKGNNALHSESRESPKRPRLDDSPKQLEFTLKISKDASTNIPKATMSPKRTVSPQRFPEPPLSRISSEVSITPVLSPPASQDKKTVAKPARHVKVNDASTEEPSPETNLAKVDNRVPTVVSHVNNIPPINKTDLTNCNNISVSADKSIIDIKNEIPMVSPVNISVRGRRGKRGEIHQNPGPPRRRGRPPKRPVEYIPLVTGNLADEYEMGYSSPGELPGSISSTTSRGRGRPVRECRDRTRPIVFKTRKPRGAGNPRGRGGRGGARIPLVPGREALSAREQEELDRIEARNQQLRLEKLAKREAKLAKLAKKAKRFSDEPPPPPPRELTEEEKAELAVKREAEERAAAEARALAAEARAIAAKEAERKAQEAAAAKELEKLAKIAARKERLRELHRMKREKILAKKAAKKLKDEERRKRKAAEKAAEQAAALQSMYEDETRMSAPDGSLRPLYGDDTPNRNKTGRMEINLSESKEVSVEQLAEYQWENGELYMIQEQVAEYLGVKSFKRKYPDLKRRPVDAEERKYLEDTCLVPKSLCDLGITAVSSAEVLDIMFQDFPDKYEEVRRYLREKQMKEISSKQRALSLYSRQQSDKAKADLREQAMECAATWNAHLNRERREERKCSMDLQSFIIHYPLTKRESMKQTTNPPGNYPVAVLPGQFCDFYKRYTSNELMYFPLNTVLYGPLKPNERRLFSSDASQSESEESSSSESSSSSEDSGSESEGDEDTKCKICSSSRTSRTEEGGGKTLLPPLPPNKPEIFLPCTKCKLYCHPSCCNITPVMLPHVRKYNWVCLTCKVCVKCNLGDTHSKMRLCDLCDRGFHVSCLDPRKMVPEGNRWHCAVCSFCWACLAREPGGPSNQWLHEFIKDETGEKVYQRSLCAACCAKVGREAAAAVAAAAAAASGSGQQPGPSGVKLGSSTVTTSGTMTPPVATVASTSASPQTTPLRGYQILHTKDNTQLRLGNPQVRLALSQTLNSMVVRASLRGASPSARLPFSPDSGSVRPGAGRGSGDSTPVVRTPTGMVSRPRQGLVMSPNNRLETLSPPPPSINVNTPASNSNTSKK